MPTDSPAIAAPQKESLLIMKRVRSLLATGLPRRSSPRAVALIAVALLAGCGGVRPRAAPLDENLARTSLKTALDAWKKGDSPAALKDGSPSIVAQDPDWVGGARLLAYEIGGDGERIAENLFVPVKLTVKTKKGKQAQSQVKYVIGTSPQIMVFRSLR
jgi:hypothetical protein